MKFFSFTLLLTLLGVSLTGCRNDADLELSPNAIDDNISGMIYEFHNRIHPGSSVRSNKPSFRITGISTETFQISDSVKTRSSLQSESYDIHTVSLDFEGTPGYAVLSDTPGINKIFYYTEEGCIGDTAVIEPLKDMIECFPKMAEDIISGKIADTRADLNNYPDIQPLVPFHWHQLKPFNNYSAYCSCSECSLEGNHRPIGCVPLALGQTLATIKKFTGTFYGNRDIDFDNLPRYGTGGTGAQYLQVAHFLQEIALNCQVKFNCDKSVTTLEAARNYLKDLGFNPTLNYGGLLELKYLDNLTRGIPVIAGGSNGSAGHAWILDGYTNNISGRHYHINWGWGYERSDGWALGIYFGYHSNDEGEEWVEYGKKLKQLYLE